jgi:hypothetical protein
MAAEKVETVLPALDWKHPDYEPIIQERMRRLQTIRSTPGMVEGLKEFYKENPAQFITDWGVTSDPRNADVGLPVTVPFVLFPKQAEFIDWLVERWKGREDGLVEKSRDMGLSWLCVSIAATLWLFNPGIVIGFGSRKEEYVDRIGDPKSLFWKLREFINNLPIEFQPSGWNADKHAPFMRVLNPENGAAIVGEAGDNIGRGNRTAIYFKDESAFYERPDAIDAALSQTSNCKIDVSTPNGSGNPFYRKRFGGKLKVFVFDWRDDPRKDEAWYQRQCETLEPHVVAQEIDRNYEASVINAFVPGPLVDDAMRRGPTQVEAIGRLRVGVDPARFGNDKFAVTIRRGRLVLKIEETQKLDSIQGATWVKSLLDPYGEMPGQIAVDEIGVGAGVVDQLRGWYGDTVVGVNSSLRMDGDAGSEFRGLIATKTMYYNMRALMWGEMREWLAGASMPMDHELKAELTAPRYSYRGGSLILESKDDMKARGVKSPNRADSLALTFADPREPQQILSHPVFGAAAHAQIGRKPASRAGY